MDAEEEMDRDGKGKELQYFLSMLELLKLLVQNSESEWLRYNYQGQLANQF